MFSLSTAGALVRERLLGMAVLASLVSLEAITLPEALLTYGLQADLAVSIHGAGQER